MNRKWIFTAIALTTTSALALPEMQAATPEDLERFEVVAEAIQTKTFRDKVLICAAPEWADKPFIVDCIEDSEAACTFTSSSEKSTRCINGQDPKPASR